jgi:tRNA-specific 2-thiouridylase
MMSDKWDIKLLEPSFSPWQPKKEISRQIALLMSGGVDSSVTAHLLKEAGWEVLGVTMKIPVCSDTNTRGCCGADAAFVCHELDIPHYFVDVTEAFNELIIERFRQSYARGETPSPCVDCNTFLKFSLLWDFLRRRFGIGFLASGHYARVSKTPGRVRLGRAAEKSKDQSYFLYGIAAQRLAGLVLPLGEYSKQQVRSIAGELSLSVADKAESMELCFAGEGDYRAALGAGEADCCGTITDMQGKEIGMHKGISNYTLGQRRGVGFAGGKPLYVSKIDARTNTITLGTREEVSSRTIKANKVNVLMPEELIAGGQFLGKIRSYGDPSPCRVADVADGKLTVEFDQPQFAPCPGQRLVLYNSDDNIVAGGTISASATT